MRRHPRTTAALLAVLLVIPVLLAERLAIPISYRIPNAEGYARLWLRITYALPVLSAILSVAIAPSAISRVLRTSRAWIGPACVAADVGVYVVAGIFERSFKATAILPLATASSLGALITGIVLYEQAPKVIDWAVAFATSVSAVIGGFQIAEAFGASTFIGQAIVRGDQFFATYTNTPLAWHRAEGLALNPNIYAPLATVGLLWAVFGPQRGPSRWITIVSSVAIAGLAMSRTTIVVVLFLAILALGAAFEDRSHGRVSRRAIALLGVVVLAAVLVIGIRAVRTTAAGTGTSIEAVEQFMTDPDSDSGVSGRLEMWAETVEAIKAQPMGYFQEYRLQVRPYPHPHNEALYRLLYAGPLWLAVFVVFVGWLALWLRPPGAAWLGPAMGVALVTNSVTETLAWMRPYTVLLFVLIGAAMLMKANATGEDERA